MFSLFFTDKGVLDDRQLGWLEGQFAAMEGCNQQIQLRERTKYMEKPPLSPNSSLQILLQQSVSTEKKLLAMGEEQKTTNVLLGKVVSLLESAAGKSGGENGEKSAVPEVETTSALIHQQPAVNSKTEKTLKENPKPKIVDCQKVNMNYREPPAVIDESTILNPNQTQHVCIDHEEDWDEPSGIKQKENKENKEKEEGEHSGEEVDSTQNATASGSMTKGFHRLAFTSTPNQVKNKVTFSGIDESQTDVSLDTNVELLARLISENLSKRSNINSVNNVSNANESRINVEFSSNESNVQRRYCLNKKMNFETFKDFLFTELKSKKLFYVLNETESVKVDKQRLEHDQIRVKDIIINHLGEEYNSDLVHLSNPIDLLQELKERKLAEIGINEHIAYKNLITIRYDSRKETGFDFVSRFERTVRTYENHSKSSKFSEDEKRKLFYNAVEKAIPSVAAADCVSRASRGVECDYKSLKQLVLQVGPKKIVHQVQPNAMNARSYKGERQGDGHCYKCGSFEHKQYQCTVEKKKCFKCNGDDHIQYNCPLKQTGDNGGKASTSTKRVGYSGPMAQRDEPANKRFKPNQGYPQNQPQRRFSGERSGGQQQQLRPNQGRKNKNKRRFKPKANLVGENDNAIKSSSEGEESDNELGNFIVDSGATEHMSNA